MTVRSSSRAALTRDAIVDAAARLAASGPADHVTMRRLGEALGADPTAVYRHFRDKAELMRALGDRLLADVVSGADLTGAWRDNVVTVCLRLREVLLRHPALAAAVRDAPPLEPGEFVITEALLQELLDGGLSAADAALGYHSVIELTIGSATIDAAQEAAGRHDRDGRYDRWRRAYADLPAAQFPASRRVSAELYRGSASERFVAALERLLDGIAMRG